MQEADSRVGAPARTMQALPSFVFSAGVLTLVSLGLPLARGENAIPLSSLVHPVGEASDSPGERACFATSGRLEACKQTGDCSSWLLYHSANLPIHSLFDHCHEEPALAKKMNLEKVTYVQENNALSSTLYIRANTCIPGVQKYFVCVDGDAYQRSCDDTALEKVDGFACVVAENDSLAARTLWLPVVVLTAVCILILSALGLMTRMSPK